MTVAIFLKTLLRKATRFFNAFGFFIIIGAANNTLVR